MRERENWSCTRPGRRTTRIAGSSLIVLTLWAICACGGSGAPTRQRAPANGPAVFATACGACHSLAGNENRQTQGGDLLGYRMSRSEMLAFTREMPVRHRLSAGEVVRVADYVLDAERRSRRPR